MKKFHYIISLFSVLFLFSCNEENVDLDNDSDERYEVVIDAIKYPLSPGKHIKLMLEPGPHHIEIINEDGKTTEEEDFIVEKGGLINVGKKDYYIWTDLYGDTSLKEERLKEDWASIGEKKYFGEFEVVEPTALYIEKRWDYDLEEPFPGDLLGWQFTEEKYIIKKKLFREKDLVEAYNQLAQDPEAN